MICIKYRPEMCIGMMGRIDKKKEKKELIQQNANDNGYMMARYDDAKMTDKRRIDPNNKVHIRMV